MCIKRRPPGVAYSLAVSVRCYAPDVRVRHELKSPGQAASHYAHITLDRLRSSPAPRAAPQFFGAGVRLTLARSLLRRVYSGPTKPM